LSVCPVPIPNEVGQVFENRSSAVGNIDKDITYTALRNQLHPPLFVAIGIHGDRFPVDAEVQLFRLFHRDIGQKHLHHPATIPGVVEERVEAIDVLG
jgi:hypothetical protein